MTSATLSRVIDYIDAYTQDSITLDDLAREANLSKFHFLRAFVATMGMTPHRYLVEIRMARAAELLTVGDQTVSAIAALCGYSSSARFSANFRQHYGTTPGAFRQRRE
ncbi:MAG: AraC family transcriptional regulator [Mycobacterium sp.]